MSRNIGLRGSFGEFYFQIPILPRSIAKWLISIQFIIVSYIHPLSVIVGDIFFIVVVQESFKGHGRFGEQLRGLFSSEKSNICKSSPVVCPVKMYTSMHKWH